MKKALTLNAIFSGVSGIILILFQNQMAAMFGWTSPTAFWITGIALLFFSLTIFYEVKKLNRTRIIWIITQDMLWVFASAYVLLAKPFEVSNSGKAAIALVAIVVLAMAVNQWRALRKSQDLV